MCLLTTCGCLAARRKFLARMVDSKSPVFMRVFLCGNLIYGTEHSVFVFVRGTPNVHLYIFVSQIPVDGILSLNPQADSELKRVIWKSFGAPKFKILYIAIRFNRVVKPEQVLHHEMWA